MRYDLDHASAVLVLVWLPARVRDGRPPGLALTEATSPEPRASWPGAFFMPDSSYAGQQHLFGTALEADNMVVVMTAEAGDTEVAGVVDRVRAAGGDAFVSRGMARTIVGLVGDVDHLDTLNLRAMPGVSDVVRISSPYKLVSREHHRERSVIRVAGVPIGPDTLTVIAGPCAVETAEQTLAAALMARAAGASLLRGGAYKPRSSPYAFQGLGEAGLKILD